MSSRAGCSQLSSAWCHLHYSSPSSPRESHLSFSVEVWVCMNQSGGTLRHVRKQKIGWTQRPFTSRLSSHETGGHRQDRKGFEHITKVRSSPSAKATPPCFQPRPPNTITSNPDPGNPSGENHEANLAEPPQTAITLKTTFCPVGLYPREPSPGERRRWHDPEALLLVQNDSLPKEPPCLQTWFWRSAGLTASPSGV